MEINSRLECVSKLRSQTLGLRKSQALISITAFKKEGGSGPVLKTVRGFSKRVRLGDFAENGPGRAMARPSGWQHNF